MNLRPQSAVAVGCALLLSGCLHFPGTVEEGTVTIQKVTKMLECELAAVASNSALRKKFDLGNWGAKATLELTVVTHGGGDAAVTLFVPYVLAPLGITPKLGADLQNTSTSHLEYYVPIHTKLADVEAPCVSGNDPSGTGIGLATWFASTLVATDLKHHAGLSYTSEFQITLDATARLGYTITRVGVDAGIGIHRIGTHRVVIAVSPPPGPVAAIPVYTVDNPNGHPKDVVPSLTRGKRTTAPVRGARSLPGVYNPALDRLLFQQQRIQLAPGQAVR